MPKHAIIVQSYPSKGWAGFTHLTNPFPHPQAAGAPRLLIVGVL